MLGSCRDDLSAYSPGDDRQRQLRKDFLSHCEQHPNDGWQRTCRPAHLTASSLICSPDGDQVVLVFHRKLQRWLQTGGHAEPGDATLAEAALREANEESGLELRPASGGVLHLDSHPVPCGGPDGVHLDVRYLFLADPGQGPVVSSESEQVRWFDSADLPVADASVTELVAAAQHRLGHDQPV